MVKRRSFLRGNYLKNYNNLAKLIAFRHAKMDFTFIVSQTLVDFQKDWLS